MAAGVSRGRRVLGEKDRNTIVGVSVGVDVDTNNKAAISLSKPQMDDGNTATSSPKTGQKRKFDSVEEDGGQDGSQQSSNSGVTEPLSTLTSLSDAISSCPVYETADDTSPLNVSIDSQADDNVVQSTLDTSLSQPPHSQGDVGADPPDTYFEIHEEMSQGTLDKLHAVSLSQPQQQPSSLLNPPLALPRPSLAKENSQSSVSMSSLIGFDEKDGSQESVEAATQQQQQSCTQSFKTEHHQDQNTDATTNASSCRTEEAERKEGEDGSRRAAAMAAKAQTLRTRLQLAYYKVTTNQASTPFSRLAAQQRQQQASASGRSRLLSPPQLVPAYHGRNRYDDDSAEWRIAAARQRAAMQQKPGIRSLNDSEIPSIRPTEFSARWMDGGVGSSLGAAAAAAVPTTPIQANRRREEEEEEEGKKRGEKHERDDYDSNSFAGLTSSVVKGEAADLLLQLNRASATPGPATHG